MQWAGWSSNDPECVSAQGDQLVVWFYDQIEMSFDLSKQTRTRVWKDLFLDCGSAVRVRDDKCGAHGQWSAVRGDNGQETGDSHTPALITRHTGTPRVIKDPEKWIGCRWLSKNDSWKLHRLDEYSSFNIVGENCTWPDMFLGKWERIKIWDLTSWFELDTSLFF